MTGAATAGAGRPAVVRPGWGPSGGGAVLATTLLGVGNETGLTARFVERAFAFPVVGEPLVDDDGAVVGLALNIVPRYLPAAGTLALSATVTDTDTGAAVPVRCAVHYARVDGALRYRVAGPAGPPSSDGSVRAAPLAVPSSGGLAALAGGWARAAPRTVRVLRGGEVASEDTLETVRVHVGVPELPPGLRWVVGGGTAHSEVDRRRAERAERRAAGLPYGAAPDVADPVEGVRAELARYRARTGGADAGPGTAVEAVGLADALGGGAFAVAGTAFFRPARPFDPAPTVPAPTAAVSMAAAERFSFTYPPRR